MNPNEIKEAILNKTALLLAGLAGAERLQAATGNSSVCSNSPVN